jgi:hypothetical protein
MPLLLVAGVRKRYLQEALAQDLFESCDHILREKFMAHHTLSIAPGVITEHVGDDVMAILPGSTDVLTLSGDAAIAVRAVQAGDAPVLPTATVSELVERGVLVTRSGMTRRGLIKAGAIGAGAGIAVLAMPGVAAASSGEGLFGSIFAAPWQQEDIDRSPNISAKLNTGAGGDSWVAALNVPEGAPYSADGFSSDDPVLDGGVAVEGTIVVGGLTRTAYLYAYQGEETLAYWFFKGTWTKDLPNTAVPQGEEDFVLTFTFGGTAYRVVPGTMEA